MAEKKRTRQPDGASSIHLGKDGKGHGRVAVGVRDDGKPDRRHIERRTTAPGTVCRCCPAAHARCVEGGFLT